MRVYNKRYKPKSSRFYKIFTAVLIIAIIGVIGFGKIRSEKLIEQNKTAAEQIKKEANSEAQTGDKSDNPTYKYEGKNWLAIGDGITSANQYQHVVAKACRISNVTTAAASGLKLGKMADKLTQEDLADIDLVTVFGGTNDYGTSKLLGMKEDNKNIDKFYGNIRKVISRIQSLNPNAKIIFITPLKRGKVGNQPVYPAPNKAGNTLEQYVEAIKYVCGQNSIQVIDLFNDSGIDISNLSQYTTNNVNLNDAGYEKISGIIADQLENPK